MSASLLAGCGHSSSRSTLTVYAASSLTDVFTQLGDEFQDRHPDTNVRFSFGSSSTLATQLGQGAPADVFASASVASMRQAVEAAAVEHPSTFASNVAEIAVAPEAADEVRSLADLAKPGVKVALCESDVPCGALAETVLDHAHVTVHPATRQLDVRSTLATVTGGQADAAIVYVTDVQAAGAAVVGVAIPASMNSTTTYPIAVVSASKHPDLATEFITFVRSARGRKALRAAGFGMP
jgi:molybdate transport system substrate-binding protein